MAIRPKVGGFPVLAEVLRRAGTRRNEWTLPSGQSLYETDLGAVVQAGPRVESSGDVPTFDERALVAAIRSDQAGRSTFPEFLAAAWSAGVVRYVCDFDARTVTYFGLGDARYVEAYPAANLD